MLATPDRWVATQIIPALKGRYFIPWNLIAAASVLTMAVPVIVYALLQKYYVKGIVGGVIKG